MKTLAFATPLFAAMFLFEAAAWLAIVGTAQTEEPVLDNDRLAIFNFAGSVLGGFVALLIFTPRSRNRTALIRRYLAKGAGSMASGFCIAPALLERSGYPRTSTWAICFSFTTAVFAVAFLHQAAPILQEWIPQKLRKLLNLKDPAEKETP